MRGLRLKGPRDAPQEKPLLPERQEANGPAPGEWEPYGRYELFDESGNIKQVTTYDRFGNRIRQYDVGEGARHGEGYHEFDCDANNPRQTPGGGRRSPHRPFSNE